MTYCCRIISYTRGFDIEVGLNDTIAHIREDLSRQGAISGYFYPMLRLIDGVDVDLHDTTKLSDFSAYGTGFSCDATYSLVEGAILLTPEDHSNFTMAPVPPPRRRRRTVTSG
jgi:hypothetical protein